MCQESALANQPTASVFMGSTASEIFSVRPQVEHSNVRISNPRRPAEMRANAILCLQTGHIGRSFGEPIRFTSASYDFSLRKFDRQFSSSWNVPVRVNWRRTPVHLTSTSIVCRPQRIASNKRSRPIFPDLSSDQRRSSLCPVRLSLARGDRRTMSARPTPNLNSWSLMSSYILEIDPLAG